MRAGLAPLILFLTLLAGCTPGSLVGRPVSRPSFENIRKVAILPPRIEVFEIGAGEVVQKMDDWTEQALQNVLVAVEKELRIRLTPAVRKVDQKSLSDAEKAELEEMEALFDAVSASVLLHIYGPPEHRFEDKINQFDYSLGSESAKLRIEDADTLLLIWGFDQISTAGRMAVQVTRALATAALGIAVGPQMGVTAIIAALVDARTGEIQWYNFNHSAGGFDLRDRASASQFVNHLFSALRAP